MAELKGTVAVVTGAGRGIGREIALHQAQGGAKVAVLARTAREIEGRLRLSSMQAEKQWPSRSI
jgi:NAD(P)-dependent dehydrogenase (short-subunit alcohol dehydrogenase family)